MKILFIGDIVGRSGRESVVKGLPNLKTKFNQCMISELCNINLKSLYDDDIPELISDNSTFTES